ncbi:hypothetical protein P153DRAFT_272006, partial [Dothidotthia symphoricarpi CBS 119687]
RLTTELSLLTTIYPSQIHHNPQTNDLKYTQGPATLHLRLPSTYPTTLPDLITATSLLKTDIRALVTQQFHAVRLSIVPGEEALDILITAFRDVLARAESTADGEKEIEIEAPTQGNAESKTVIIWLHHLLNTNKRKLALGAPSPISGLAKPGYPGVILYTGPVGAVDEHVGLLRRQNWQAFQVRYEEGEVWEMGGGGGVREVESMSEAVRVVGEGRKEEFLRAVGIK